MLGDTPMTSKGLSWLPLTQLMIWVIFVRSNARRNPGMSRLRAISQGFLQMVVMLGSEWGHNLAHLAASNWIGKPMDEFRIQLGMPRCVYRELITEGVSPGQHIIRSLGGPVFNLILVPFAGVMSLMTRQSSSSGKVARTALHTNLFLTVISLLPIPGIDGGPLLKWRLVQRGRTVVEADEIVRRINGPLAFGLGLFSSLAFARKKILAGLFGAMLGLTSLSIFAGWIKEEDVSI
jgi:hypothetical protein